MERQYTKYQQNIIRNFYDNRGAIGLQRLSELVTELYLAEGKKRDKLWDQIEGALAKCDIKPDRIAMLRKKNDPAALATVVQELMAK